MSHVIWKGFFNMTTPSFDEIFRMSYHSWLCHLRYDLCALVPLQKLCKNFPHPEKLHLFVKASPQLLSKFSQIQWKRYLTFFGDPCSIVVYIYKVIVFRIDLEIRKKYSKMENCETSLNHSTIFGG